MAPIQSLMTSVQVMVPIILLVLFPIVSGSSTGGSSGQSGSQITGRLGHRGPSIDDLKRPLSTSTQLCQDIEKNSLASSIHAAYTEDLGKAIFECEVDNQSHGLKHEFFCDMTSKTENQNVLYVLNGVAFCYRAHHYRRRDLGIHRVNGKDVSQYECLNGPDLKLESWSTLVIGWFWTTEWVGTSGGASGHSVMDGRIYKYFTVQDLELHRTRDPRSTTGHSGPASQMMIPASADQWAAFWELCGTAPPEPDLHMTIAFISDPTAPQSLGTTG